VNHFQGSPILRDSCDPSLLRTSIQWTSIQWARTRKPIEMERLLGVFLWAAFIAVLLSLGE